MQIRGSLLALMIVFTTTPNRVFAEVPPLSKGELDNAAALIVTGMVTDVKVGTAKARPYGIEYAYDLTVQVEKLEKGNLEPGTTLVARGFYVKLKSGYDGSTGHRSGHTNDRINAIGPGSELTLHLWESNDGTYRIVAPNGFAVLRMVPPADAWWHWIFGCAVLGSLLLVGVFLWRR
jgi:hypothetical protein